MNLYWNRNQGFILSGSLLVVVVLGISLYVMWISPLHEERESLTSQIVSKENEINALRQAEEERSISKAEAEQLQNILPVEEREDQFLVLLEKAEASSLTSIRSITSVEEAAGTEEDDTSGIQPLSYELDMRSGSFGDLTEFLSRIEEMERYVRVESVTFDSASVEENGGRLLSYSVQVSAYHYPALEAMDPGASGYHYGEPSGKVTPFETR
ncbi:type 4a pilus biogenesis protein PilO [Salimicrobium sp. PL1-032A]|uniref:type 4a pilus biogenesis protein PilO n=1 Tax=Salimicrobium sp. PL1-032A TaxID=3095364 RepID=UPI00326013D4